MTSATSHVKAKAVCPRTPLSPALRHADVVAVWMLIPVGGFLFGLVFGRWWGLIAAIPLGAWILATSPLEGNVGVWVAAVLSALLGCAIAAGVALRRLRERRLRA